MPNHTHEPATPALAGYAADAAFLIPRYESVSAAEKLRNVAHLIPAQPARIADIGAGTGVDAAWLAAQGHLVLAVEPTDAFREAGQRLDGSGRIEWLDDRLPGLEKTLAREVRFHVVLLSAVWAHLPEELRPDAMLNIRRVLTPERPSSCRCVMGPHPRAGRPTPPRRSRRSNLPGRKACGRSSRPASIQCGQAIAPRG